jgi:hypothetical protein
LKPSASEAEIDDGNSLTSTAAALATVEEELPPIRMIAFETFQSMTSFPRLGLDSEISVCNLVDIDRNDSFLVFISHCWMRGWPGAPGWDGRPHPDNLLADKHKLCCEGISKLWRSLAPGMVKCYVWLDFGCMNQDSNPAGELKQLDKIMQSCDCMFTPIVDHDQDPWELPLIMSNWYEEYASPLWNKGTTAYLNRAWYAQLKQQFLFTNRILYPYHI